MWISINWKVRQTDTNTMYTICLWHIHDVMLTKSLIKRSKCVTTICTNIKFPQYSETSIKCHLWATKLWLAYGGGLWTEVYMYHVCKIYIWDPDKWLLKTGCLLIQVALSQVPLNCYSHYFLHRITQVPSLCGTWKDFFMKVISGW